MKRSFLNVAGGRILLFQSLSKDRPLTQNELVEIINHDTNIHRFNAKQMAQHNILCFILAEVKKLNNLQDDEFEKFCDLFDEFDQSFMNVIDQGNITKQEMQNWTEKFDFLFVDPETSKLSQVDAVNIINYGTKNAWYMVKALENLIYNEEEPHAKKEEEWLKVYLQEIAEMYPLKLNLLLNQFN